MKTNYEQIVNVANIGKRCNTDINTIFKMAEKETSIPAENDTKRRLLLCIDVQNDFIEGGALPVPNSVKDVERLTRFIYNNLQDISCIACSMDTHMPYQIFHPCWWVDSKGEHPEPYTIITYQDVVNNRWKPIIGNPKDSLDYLEALENSKEGKKKLCIWPYHCIYGTDGNTLENEFAKMVYFHSVVRKTKNDIIQKGTEPYSEMYGIIKPEYSKTNFINTQVLTLIENYDEIYIAGEAASHCVMESVRQIAEYFSNRPEITKKITILEDCTSPITGYEDETKLAFANFKNLYGIKIANSLSIKF